MMTVDNFQASLTLTSFPSSFYTAYIGSEWILHFSREKSEKVHGSPNCETGKKEKKMSV